jgi:hypothetical protein
VRPPLLWPSDPSLTPHADSSDKILVNSEFTQRQFGKSFPRLRREPRVLYPGIDAEHYDAQGVKQAVDALGELGSASSVRHCIRDLCMGTCVFAVYLARRGG